VHLTGLEYFISSCNQKITSGYPNKEYRQHHSQHCAEQGSIVPETLRKEHYQIVFCWVQLPQIIGKADEVKLQEKSIKIE
jgi:hypothetical protein